MKTTTLSADHILLEPLRALWWARWRRPTARAGHPAAPDTLARGATVWVPEPRGTLVLCGAGTLWITFDGEPEDCILEAGQSLRCTKASKLGITALSAARFSLV